MKKIPLLSELLEAGEDHASQASQDAKRLGLTYMQFGRYGQNGKVTHNTVDGKLVPVDQHKANMKQMGGARTIKGANQAARSRVSAANKAQAPSGKTGIGNAIAQKNPAYGKNVAGDMATGSPLARDPNADPFDPYAGDLPTSATPNVNKMGSMTPPKPPAPPATPTRSPYGDDEPEVPGSHFTYGDAPADAAPQGRQQAPSTKQTVPMNPPTGDTPGLDAYSKGTNSPEWGAYKAGLPKLGDLTPPSDDSASDPVARKAKLAGYQKMFAPQSDTPDFDPPENVKSGAADDRLNKKMGATSDRLSKQAWDKYQATQSPTQKTGTGIDGITGPRAANIQKGMRNDPMANATGPRADAISKAMDAPDKNIAPLPQEPNINKLSSMAPPENFNKGDEVHFKDRNGGNAKGTVIHKHDDNGPHAGHYNVKRHTNKPEYPHTVHGSQMKRSDQPDAERFSADKEAENNADSNPSLYGPDD